jgi:hypothetical protein
MFFKKSGEPDILPPPPPFPKLELEEVKASLKEEIKQLPEAEKVKTKAGASEEETLSIIKELEEKKPKKGLLPEQKPSEIKKPPEISVAEQEIEKAIEELRKKQKKPPRLFAKKERPKQIPFPETPTKRESAQQQLPYENGKTADEVTIIKHRIYSARNALMDLDLDKAKIIYIRIMELYNKLSPEKQARVYGEIKDLYDERKKAESLNLKA